ncbi:MAG: Holliday junction branch migration protein RuvA [Chloroflexota bacterium]
MSLIAAVEGKLEAKGPEGATVKVGGLSILVQTPLSVLDKIGPEGSVVRLYTHLHVREDTLALFGFASQDELRTFQLLITVSGIGPKLALGVLSNLAPDGLRAAIAAGNVDALTHIPGIGKRTAGRLVLELREKLGPAADEAPAVLVAESGDLAAALSNLGYNPLQIQSALRSLPTDDSVSLEDRLVMALRYLAPH